MPLFDQGQAAVAAAQSRLRRSQQRSAALAVEIRAQVRRAHHRMLAARGRAAYYARVIIPLRHQIVQETLLQYNAMQVGTSTRPAPWPGKPVPTSCAGVAFSNEVKLWI